MKRTAIGLGSALIVLGLFGGARQAGAGFPWFKAPAAEGPAAYAPVMSHYVVVSPTPPTGKPGSASDCAPWTANREVVPNYPWGWFGGRTPSQPWSHTGYYGNYRDHAIIRQD